MDKPERTPSHKMKKAVDASEARALREQLKALVNAVRAGLAAIDLAFKIPVGAERGRALVRAVNAIDLAQQIAARHGLGWPAGPVAIIPRPEAPASAEEPQPPTLARRGKRPR